MPHNDQTTNIQTLTYQLEKTLTSTPSQDILDEQAQILHQLFTMMINEKVTTTDDGTLSYRYGYGHALEFALNIQKQCTQTIKAKGAIDYMSAITPARGLPPPPKIEKQKEGSQVLPIETKGWSKERRAKQAENMRKTKPWKHATGPKTKAGKAASSQNALRSGLYTVEIKALRYVLKQQQKFLNTIKSLP